MNKTALLGALLLLASTMTAPGVVATDEQGTDEAQHCDFIVISPFFPFVTIDPTCPPFGPVDGF